jgi:hypothetical protein
MAGFAKLKEYAQSAAQKVGSEVSAYATKAKQAIDDFTTPEAVGKARRSAGALPKDGKPAEAKRATAEYSQPPETKDWRVRLSMPRSIVYDSSPLLAPLKVTNGLVFPFTPTVILQGGASYTSMDPVHSNFQFKNYIQSEVANIVLTGDFILQTQDDARYWVGVIHYLRSITKMAYGNSPDRGSPPPVINLNGYGDYVFKNVPVVVTNWVTDLPNDVDYISTGLEIESEGNSSAITWAPVKSTISITVQPIYSRRQAEQFSLSDFVSGGYVKNGKGFI